MAYEYESRLKNRLLDLEFDTWEETAQCEREYRELEHVYRKAKVLDEVKNFTTERLKEQKLTDEYDFGERLICEEIEDIIGGQIND
jgi:hypothetical protein